MCIYSSKWLGLDKGVVYNTGNNIFNWYIDMKIIIEHVHIFFNILQYEL